MTEGRHGAIGDEAVKLLDAVQEWLRREPISEHLATGAPECTWCPICQFVAVLRGERPDVNERVALVVAALRAMFDQAEGRPAQPQRVQHIDLGGEP
ncbi:MAG TPA: hypothetical protein VGJ59_15445 [Jatrophihabitantaceae bacterium]|jgi:hypothetical protein